MVPLRRKCHYVHCCHLQNLPLSSVALCKDEATGGSQLVLTWSPSDDANECHRRQERVQRLSLFSLVNCTLTTPPDDDDPRKWLVRTCSFLEVAACDRVWSVAARTVLPCTLAGFDIVCKRMF